ncbi:MAG: hypothetical protein GY771_13680 [bacterium]|nr:hypothetical protein [bacterium]
MKCPTCGCDAVEDAVYCSDCGAILRPDVPEIQGTFVCIVIAFTRTAHDDSRTASDMKVQDEIDRALAQSAEIAGRASLANTRLSDDEIAILYPFNIDYRENIDEAISSVVTLRDELALFIAESEVIALGIGIEIGEITYRDFILTSATGKDSPVNNALRLVRKATPNAILVSDNTAGLIEDYYQLKPVGFYRLYGGEDALKIYELIAPTPETTTPPLLRNPTPPIFPTLYSRPTIS